MASGRRLDLVFKVAFGNLCMMIIGKFVLNKTVNEWFMEKLYK